MKTTFADLRVFFLPSALVLLAAPLAQAALAQDRPGQDRPAPQGTVQQRVVAGSNGLGFRLLAKLLGHDPGKNLFLSPASIATALTLTWTGAEGETAAALAATLGFEGAPRAEVLAATKSLLEGLSGRKGIELKTAQAIWGRSGVAFQKEFVEDAKRFFAAEVKSADFADPKTLAAINDWVSRQTGGKIQGALDRIPPDALLYLLSAIWFKAQWLEKFDPKRTLPEGVFHRADGKETRVPTMRRRGDFLAYEDATLKAVKLPYADKKTSMVLLLPADKSAAGLAALAAQAGAMDFPAWLKKLETRAGHVALPRFRMNYGVDLRPVLGELGMSAAFDGTKADFGRMREQPGLAISRVLHKSFVEVNEAGTEAAAATIVEIKGADSTHEFELLADRPFLFAICDDEQGTVLFAGVVLDPTA